MLFIREVWYGQRSLAETWWFWDFLIGNVILGNIVLAIVSFNFKIFPLYLYLILTLLYAVWVSVGLWRSASNTESCWGGGIKILLVLRVLIFLFELFSGTSARSYFNNSIF